MTFERSISTLLSDFTMRSSFIYNNLHKSGEIGKVISPVISPRVCPLFTIVYGKMVKRVKSFPILRKLEKNK